MKTRVLPTFLTLTITLGLAPLCLAQSDDFDDGNDFGWTRYNPIGVGSWSVVDGGYRIQTAPSPAPDVVGPGRAGSLRNDVTYTNFQVSVDITNWNDSVHQAFGILARITDPAPGATKGYAFTYDRGTTPTSGDMDMSVITGEVPSGVSGVSGEDNIHLLPGRTYRFVFIGVGPNLEGLVYEHPNLTNPVVRMVGSDTTYESGVCGLVVYDSSAGGMGITDATFDNYSAMIPPPPPPPPPPQLAIARTTEVEGVIVSWPTNAVGFVLQAGDALPPSAPGWADITDGILVNEMTGRYEYFDFTSGGNNLFFRLRQPPP
jgi:hypothetical protein